MDRGIRVKRKETVKVESAFLAYFVCLGLVIELRRIIYNILTCVTSSMALTFIKEETAKATVNCLEHLHRHFNGLYGLNEWFTSLIPY